MRALLLGLALSAAGVTPVCAQDAEALRLFTEPGKGHCSACHQLPAGIGPANTNDLGPALTGPRMRELGKPRLSAVITDPTVATPTTLMPPFGRHRILDAREIARLVEFLHALP